MHCPVHCRFTGLVQRMLKCDKIQDSLLNPHNVLNIMTYGSLFFEKWFGFRPFGMDNLIKTVKVAHNEMLSCFTGSALFYPLSVFVRLWQTSAHIICFDN